MKIIDAKGTGWTGTVLTLGWADGTVDTFDAEALPEAIQRDLMMHGLKQKLRDDASDANQYSDPIGYAKSCAQEIWQMLSGGQWRRQGTASGSTVDLVNALHRALDGAQTLEEVSAKIMSMQTSDRTALKKHPEVAKALADIAAERAAEATPQLDIQELFQQ